MLNGFSVMRLERRSTRGSWELNIKCTKERERERLTSFAGFLKNKDQTKKEEKNLTKENNNKNARKIHGKKHEKRFISSVFLYFSLLFPKVSAQSIFQRVALTLFASAVWLVSLTFCSRSASFYFHSVLLFSDVSIVCQFHFFQLACECVF